MQITLEQIDLIKRLMSDYSKHLQLVTTANGEILISKNALNSPNFRPGERTPVREDCRGDHGGVRTLHRHLPLSAQDVQPAWSEVPRPYTQLQQPMVRDVEEATST